MRVLIDRRSRGSDAVSRDDAAPAELYAEERTPWLRANMISTVDGAGTGADGLTGSINNAADHRVFHALRGLADAVLVGAGTAVAEGYRPEDTPVVVVTGRGRVPERLQHPRPGQVLLVTCESAAGLGHARELLGGDHVLVAGQDEVDLARAVAELTDRGMGRLLCEGGPRLLGDLLTVGLVDELCTTIVPQLVGGDQPRIVTSAGMRVPLDLRLLAEEDDTVFARWTVRRDQS
ncbi:MAG TPA: dihydrofolate reductase family protein [Nocardioides sp.]|uniref:dihydrofolate reductase family protein n=1 Tax=Nocardioides sp. TaxID=35761 RepID=UPI002D80E06C|nr:dihydrofolate reductase family protein [Nocardioides sp.]HET6652214.1 dihydrofolate reductase family protein [Nocardioides sp.]